MFTLAATTRVRRSPFYQATLAEGVTSFSPYNQMWMPAGYGDYEAEYWQLINGVSMWDVAVERQVALKGPDAATLAQILSPRNLSNCAIGQGKYVALCNHAGTLINDPIVLKCDEDLYWISIADSNILYWARAIAAERKLNVQVYEPDVSPLAVQGPKAEAVLTSLCGDWVQSLKYFWFRETHIDDIPVLVARSGYSKQGGFEIYLMDGTKGTALWQKVREAGQPFDIKPGYPHTTERIESGLLSCGGDNDDTTNPFEVRLGRYLDLDVADDVVGIQALRRIAADGPARHQLGIVLNDSEAAETHSCWYDINHAGNKVGDMTNGVWSYRLNKMIGFALINRDCQPGDTVTVMKDGKGIPAQLTELPFL